MKLLDRIQPWSTTGIGSLPFSDPAYAAGHVDQSYDIPFCPQLPRVEGDMVSEWLGSDPGRCGWSPERDRQRPLAWKEFIGRLDRRRPEHGIVKLQVTGPATLAYALQRRGSGEWPRSETLEMAREISTWLAANVADRLAVLAERELETILVIDEPAMSVFGTEGATSIWDPLRVVAPAWGFHFCCKVPWGLVSSTGPDLVSFDLCLEPVDADAVAALSEVLAKGGKVAWGAVSSQHSEDPVHAIERLRTALSKVPAAATRSLVTASCGTGGMSPAREFEVVTALSEVSRSMRLDLSRQADMAA
ncbi:MAG: hypothetical protein WBW44_00575 [Solirubrobacterales bacterium]